MALGFGLFLLLPLHVLVLTIIHYLSYGWYSIRRNFNQIKSGRLGLSQSLGFFKHAEILALFIYHSQFYCGDRIVYSNSFVIFQIFSAKLILPFTAPPFAGVTSLPAGMAPLLKFRLRASSIYLNLDR